jgi:myosin-crossreactive antigen
MQEVAMWIQSSAYDIRVKSHVTLLEENMKNLEDLTEDVKDMEIKEGKKIRKEVNIELFGFNNE